MRITKKIAAKVLETVDAGLVSGVGNPILGQMCVEAAVCYALGLPHGDEPTCVSPALRALKIQLNDANWSTPTARALGLRRLAVIQLGSKGALDENEFAKRVSRLAIMVSVPLALRAAASLFSTTSEHKKSLLDAANLCEIEGSADAARAANAAARAGWAEWAARAGWAANAGADTSLSDFAEHVVQVLIDMGVPGVEWLSLT